MLRPHRYGRMNIVPRIPPHSRHIARIGCERIVPSPCPVRVSFVEQQENRYVQDKKTQNSPENFKPEASLHGDDHRAARGAAECPDDHRKHGGYHDARHDRTEYRRRGRSLRPVLQSPVLRILGLCRRRHALLRPVLGCRKRRGHSALLRHHAGLYGDPGGCFQLARPRRAVFCHAHLHKQFPHSGDRGPVPACRGLLLSADGPRRAPPSGSKFRLPAVLPR